MRTTQQRLVQRVLIPTILIYTGLVLAVFESFFSFANPALYRVLDILAIFSVTAGLLWIFSDRLERRIAARVSQFSDLERIGLTSVFTFQTSEVSVFSERLAHLKEIGLLFDVDRPAKGLLYLLDSILDSPESIRVRLLLSGVEPQTGHDENSPALTELAVHGMIRRIRANSNRVEIRLIREPHIQPLVLTPREIFVGLGQEQSRTAGVLLGFQTHSPIATAYSQAFEEFWSKAIEVKRLQD